MAIPLICLPWLGPEHTSMGPQVEGGTGAAPAPAADAELASRVNEMWFADPGGEPLTFREVFLRSQAL